MIPNDMRVVPIVLVLSLATAVVATGCKKAGTPGAPLTLHAVPIQIGDKRIKTEDMEIALHLDADGTRVEVTVVKHVQATTEVVAVDGAIATKLKVSYAGLRDVRTIGGKVKVKPQILDGKSYVVWAEGGAIQATTADGAAVSADELTELAKHNPELGKPDVTAGLLAERTWTIGEKRVATGDELAKIATVVADANQVPSEMSFTLLSFDATEARFAVTTTLVATDGDGQSTFTLKGIARVERSSGRPLETSMAGTIHGVSFGIPAAGTTTTTAMYTY